MSKDAEKSFKREVAMFYCLLMNIEVSEEMKDKALRRVISEQVEQKDPDYSCGVCGMFVGNDDKFCWNCGDDVSPDDDGGFERIHAEYLAAQPKDEKKEEATSKGRQKIDKTEKVVNLKEAAQKKADDKKAKAAEKRAAKKEAKASEKKGGNGESKVPVAPGGLDMESAVQKIKKLDQSSGTSAYDIGEVLVHVTEGQLFKQGGYERFQDFCEMELGYTRQTAYNYMRIASNFEREDAGRLNMFSLLELCKAPDTVRPKLLTKATQVTANGKVKMTGAQLKQEVRDAIEKVEPERIENDARLKRKSPFMKFVADEDDEPFKGHRESDKQCLIELDEQVGLELTILKTVVKAQFVKTHAGA